jgi:hypothetical protein
LRGLLSDDAPAAVPLAVIDQAIDHRGAFKLERVQELNLPVYKNRSSDRD